jgi:hypothetical protein
MLNPARVDAVIDLAYGALIVLSIGLIATLDTTVGLAFGVGVFSSYVLHVVWKMARFDPDWMTKAVEETVGQQVEETVERTVEETVGQQVEETVERTVGETVQDVQTRVEAVNERVDRRPREDEVEEIIEESAEDESGT